MSETRLFMLTWDNSRHPIKAEERYRKRNADGVQFATGMVALDNGSMFASMDELEHHLHTAGKFEVEYHDKAAIY